MPLHPKLEYFLIVFPSPLEPTLDSIRSRNFVISEETSIPVRSVGNAIISREEGELPIRIYTPDGVGPFPVFVYFHGGEFVYGNLDTHDSICRLICDKVK